MDSLVDDRHAFSIPFYLVFHRSGIDRPQSVIDFEGQVLPFGFEKPKISMIFRLWMLVPGYSPLSSGHSSLAS